MGSYWLFVVIFTSTAGLLVFTFGRLAYRGVLFQPII
jgi:hypothetical protein